jgi:hypothetical protein
MSFVAWNAKLLSEFFSPARQGQFVVLSVGREELDDLAPELGGYQGLLQAVRGGPPWCHPNPGPNPGPNPRIAAWAHTLVMQRTRPQIRPPEYVDPRTLLTFGHDDPFIPTYLPLLAVLVAVFTDTGGGGFYNALNGALATHPPYGPYELEQINHLWDDLQGWSQHKENAPYGILQCEVLGEQRHVGRLRAQGVFRSTDAERLGRSFLAAGLRPGQQLDNGDATRLQQAIQGDHSLSLGLRTAAGIKAYKPVLRARLQQMLQDWDGRLPVRVANGEQGTGENHEMYLPAHRDVGLSLHLSNGVLPWRLGWRITVAEADGGLEFKRGDQTWRANLNGNPEIPAFPLQGGGDGSVLEDARREGEVQIAVTVVGVDPVGPGLSQQAVFRHKILRYLIYDAVVGCLMERDGLPAHGPAYLLVAPDNANFTAVCYDKGVAVVECPTTGLPSGWALWFITDCSILTEEQRSALPNGVQPTPRPHPLRLVGGVRVRRGGHTLFLRYDLPRVELDAPTGAEVSAMGLKLWEEASDPIRTHPCVKASSVRRLWIEVTEPSWHHFKIEARQNGKTFASITLRLTACEVGHAARCGGAGIDPTGRTATENPYLSGFAIRGAPEGPMPIPRPILPTMLGSELHDDFFVEWLADLPESKFLDSLAQAAPSWLSYGEARDRVRRYLQSAGRTDSAARIIDDLRRRGMFEITTDPRGRWTGIAKVPPMIYRLPLSIAGNEVWGIAGTLAHGDWQNLSQFGMETWHDDADDSTALPVLRLSGTMDIGMPTRFLVSRLPATSIAAHSVSLNALRNTFTGIGFEQLDRRAHVQYFNPMQADWGNLDQLGDLVLLRYTDPETNSHVLHSLRSRARADGRFLYRHVVDERWGTWLAYDACVAWVEHEYHLQGLAPWPLHQEENTGDVWLPASMRVPHVLERALVAASGAPPTKCRLTRVPNRAEEGIFGKDGRGNVFGPFDPSYDKLLPAEPGCRLWLRYRWVPTPLAVLVADRLGCRLLPLSSSVAVEAAG